MDTKIFQNLTEFCQKTCSNIAIIAICEPKKVGIPWYPSDAKPLKMVIEMTITDVTIKRLRPRTTPYSLGENLFILVSKTKRKFVYKYKKTDATGIPRQKKITIGYYPSTSLAQARTQAIKFGEIRGGGGDPKELSQIAKINDSRTFEAVFTEWFDSNISERGYIQDTLKRKMLEAQKHIFPFIGDTPITKITKEQITKIIETRAKSETKNHKAHRLGNMIKSVFTYAYNKDYIDDTQEAKSRIDFNTIAPKGRTKHLGAVVDLDEFRALVNDIYAFDGNITQKNALKFVLYIPCREKSLITLKWEYIDFDKRQMTLPRGEQKIKDPNMLDFTMPLSDEVVKILQEQKAHHDKWAPKNPFVFFSLRAKEGHIPQETINKQLRQMGYSKQTRGHEAPNSDAKPVQTTHSFRQTFATIAREHIGGDVLDFYLEKFLDHKDKNKSRLPYTAKGKYTKSLLQIAQWWENFILSQLDSKGVENE